MPEIWLMQINKTSVMAITKRIMEKSLFQFRCYPLLRVNRYQRWLTTFHISPAWIICGWIEEDGPWQPIRDRGRAIGGGRNEGLGRRESMRKHGFSFESIVRLAATIIQTSRLDPFPWETKCQHEGMHGMEDFIAYANFKCSQLYIKFERQRSQKQPFKDDYTPTTNTKCQKFILVFHVSCLVLVHPRQMRYSFPNSHC